MITVGEVLKNKREQLGKSIDTVSQDTKIQRRFIKYLESNDFSPFDSEVFLTGFLKIYAQYLNLEINRVLAIYRRSNPLKKESLKKENISPIKNKKKIQINPKTLATTLLVVFLLSILGYIGFQIYKFQSPPSLEITQPKQEEEVTEETILIKGKTEVNSLLDINGIPTEIDGKGEFSKEIELKEGINIINVKAKKNNTNALETIKTLKIIYNKATEEEQQPTEETIKNILTLEVIDSSAWIKLDIDDENKLAKVVDPSKTEYSLEKKLHIISGRASNTLLYWNNEIIPWKQGQTTGVVELTCDLVGTELVCE